MTRDENPAFGLFPSTHWSLVTRAGQSPGSAQRQALGELLQRYLPALRAHLTFRLRVDPGRVEDVLQAFLVERVCERGLIGRADQARGKFRSFLTRSLTHFVANHLRLERAAKRAPANITPLDEQAHAAAGGVGEDPADAFDLAWALEVLDQAVHEMREECRITRRPEVWGVFEARTLEPTLRGEPPLAYDQLVRKFSLNSPEQASNLLITGNRMFARHLRAVIGRYELSDAQIDAEINDLWQILSRPRAG